MLTFLRFFGEAYNNVQNEGISLPRYKNIKEVIINQNERMIAKIGKDWKGFRKDEANVCESFFFVLFKNNYALQIAGNLKIIVSQDRKTSKKQQ